jgi:hypothetical protein
LPRESELTFALLVNPRQNLDEGGFSGTVVTQNTRDLSRVNRKVYVAKRDDVPEGLSDTLEFEDRLD